MRAVRRQEQKFTACQFHEINRELRFVELGVVKDDDRSGFQSRQQFRGQPFIEDIGIARSLEGHRRDQLVAEVSADQARARAFVARDIAVYLLPDERPAMRTACRWRKARFIKINKIAPLLRDFVETPQETAAVFFIALRLCVTSGFFYGLLPICSMLLIPRFDQRETLWRFP
jgi:hypothetical protein